VSSSWSEDAAVIAGIGCTTYSRSSGRTPTALAVEACERAIADAGIVKADIDGMMTYSLWMRDALAPPEVALALGLPGLRFQVEYGRGGGPSLAMLFGLAVAAIRNELATSIIIFRALNGRSGFRPGGTGWDSSTAGEAQFLVPYGLTTYGETFAMWARRHMIVHGTTSEDLANVAITARAYAAKNERAMFRDEITFDDYLASPYICEPFRLYDMCAETDGGCAIVVTSADLRLGKSRPRVFIHAVAGGGDNRTSAIDLEVNGHLRVRSHDSGYGDHVAPELYRRANMGPSDVDLFYPYDQMTIATLLALEGFGFCRKGESGRFVSDGGIGPTGATPTNTHGGLLAEAYLHNINHVYEAVEQLRGEAGERQIEGARTAVIANGHGTIGNAMVLRSE
jgi:acetyl-CoA acetyltransferase